MFLRYGQKWGLRFLQRMFLKKRVYWSHSGWKSEIWYNFAFYQLLTNVNVITIIATAIATVTTVNNNSSHCNCNSYSGPFSYANKSQIVQTAKIPRNGHSIKFTIHYIKNIYYFLKSSLKRSSGQNRRLQEPFGGMILLPSYNSRKSEYYVHLILAPEKSSYDKMTFTGMVLKNIKFGGNFHKSWTTPSCPCRKLLSFLQSVSMK